MNKVYKGLRDAAGCTVKVHEVGREPRGLDPRRDLRDYGRTEFTWGYTGHGPAQLALALLCDVLGDDALAFYYHRRFMRLAVSRLRSDKWILCERQVTDSVLLLSEWEENAFPEDPPE